MTSAMRIVPAVLTPQLCPPAGVPKHPATIAAAATRAVRAFGTFAPTSKDKGEEADMRRRVLTFIVGAVVAVAVPAPAALAEDGPCGQAPGPHCRPMDCEIVWNDPQVDSDIVPVPDTPSYKCYT